MLGAVAIDPERLIWVPGRKLISIPKPVSYNSFGIDRSGAPFVEIVPGSIRVDGLPLDQFIKSKLKRVRENGPYMLTYRLAIDPRSVLTLEESVRDAARMARLA